MLAKKSTTQIVLQTFFFSSRYVIRTIYIISEMQVTLSDLFIFLERVFQLLFDLIVTESHNNNNKQIRARLCHKFVSKA